MQKNFQGLPSAVLKTLVMLLFIRIKANNTLLHNVRMLHTILDSFIDLLSLEKALLSRNVNPFVTSKYLLRVSSITMWVSDVFDLQFKNNTINVLKWITIWEHNINIAYIYVI